jgi:hypothetical protein
MCDNSRGLPDHGYVVSSDLAHTNYITGSSSGANESGSEYPRIDKSDVSPGESHVVTARVQDHCVNFALPCNIYDSLSSSEQATLPRMLQQ